VLRREKPEKTLKTVSEAEEDSSDGQQTNITTTYQRHRSTTGRTYLLTSIGYIFATAVYAHFLHLRLKGHWRWLF